MLTNNKFGILTMAFGDDRYINQAKALARSIKYHMPDIKLALVSDTENDLSNLFDVIIAPDMNLGKGTKQKVWMDEYTPFQETFFIDSDCIVTRPFYEELDEIKKYDFSPIVDQYLSKTDQDNFVVDLEKTMTLLNLNVYPKFNGGVYFFRQSAEARKVFKKAKELCQTPETYGLIRANGKSPGDETLFSLAMAVLEITDFYFDEGKLMRTPLGIEGPLKYDPMGGGTEFIKRGKKVTPAIFHFSGDYIYWPLYPYSRLLFKYPWIPTFYRPILLMKIKIYKFLRKLIS